MKNLQETLNPIQIKESGVIKLSKWSTSFGELGEIERKVHSHSLPLIQNFQVLKRKGQSSPTKSRGTIILSPEKQTQILERKKAHSVFTNNNKSLPATGSAQMQESPTFSFVDPPSLKFLSTSHVLLVDDNPLNLIIAEYLVSSHGYRVKAALSGQAAIDMVRSVNYSVEPIQLIHMDLQIPEMDGYEATRHLKKLMQEKKVPEIPIVAFTANTSEADKEACLQAGMVAHLRKPLKEPELLKVLNDWCK